MRRLSGHARSNCKTLLAACAPSKISRPTAAQPLHHTRLRQFKRAVADLDHIETRAIAVLNRAQSDDHHVNRLLYRICQEIRYPLVTPTVTTLSTGYFYIDTKLNLMFIPPAEGSFLLHLPDLYHELGHPLLTHQDHPVLDRLRTRYLECTAQIHDHFAHSERKKISDAAHGGSRTKSTHGKSYGRSIG